MKMRFYLMTLALVLTSCGAGSDNDDSNFYVESFYVKKGKEEVRLYGYVNDRGRKVIKPQFLEASDFIQDVATVKDVDGVWKCIDKQGNVVFTSKYGKCISCDGSLYAVLDEDSGKWGFFNKDNEAVIPFIVNDPPVMLDGHYWENGVCTIGKLGIPHGLIDAKGEEIPLLYDNYSEILGYFGIHVILANEYGCTSVVKDYSISPSKIEARMDDHEAIYSLQKIDNQYYVAIAVEYPGIPKYDIGPRYGLVDWRKERQDTLYNSMDEIREQGFFVKRMLYPFKQKRDDSYYTFQENGKWGLKQKWNQQVKIPAISLKPVYYCQNEDTYTQDYIIINDGVTNGGRDYMLDGNGAQIFPPVVTLWSRPDKYGMALVECFAGKDNYKGVLNINYGLIVKKLEPTESVSEFVDGRAKISQNDAIPYEYEIDTLGIEYHDMERRRQVMAERHQKYLRDHPSSGDPVYADELFQKMEEQRKENQMSIELSQKRAWQETYSNILRNGGVIVP